MPVFIKIQYLCVDNERFPIHGWSVLEKSVNYKYYPTDKLSWNRKKFPEFVRKLFKIPINFGRIKEVNHSITSVKSDIFLQSLSLFLPRLVKTGNNIETASSLSLSLPEKNLVKNSVHERLAEFKGATPNRSKRSLQSWWRLSSIHFWRD